MKKPTKKDIIYLAIIVLLVAAVVTVSVLWSVSAKRNAEEEPSYYDKKCAAFELENFNLSKGQIIFIGDSITDGYHLDEYYADLSLDTYNRGISGDRTSGVYRRLKTSLFDLAPSVVVMMIGINDINVGLNNDEIMINYRGIIEELQANLPSTKIICESVLPMHSNVENWGIDLAARTTQIKDLNERIKTYVQGKGCVFVDLFPHFSDGSDHMIVGYSDDGLHPNSAGYVVWTNVLKPLL